MKRFLPLSLFACSLLLVGAGCTGSTDVNVDVGANPSPAAQPAPEPEPSARIKDTATFTLNEQNGSGESGTATLTALANGKTQVVLSIKGAPAKVGQPAHIHIGTCADIGPVTHALDFAVDGTSTTVLDTGLTSILEATTSLAINVHKNAAEPNVYVACADIK